MRAATLPIQRRTSAKLLTVDPRGKMGHRARSELAELLRPGDLVIANDAATLPASLYGRHLATGAPVEVRLAGRRSLAEIGEFLAVVFGEGDFRIRTEKRAPPPPLHPDDRLELGPLRATVLRLERHPRLIRLAFHGTRQEIWEGLARHGRPIQYAHVPLPLALWDTWTVIAGLPAAFEAPSAGFALDWKVIGSLATRGVRFATLTHASGISSTGDDELDARLPFDEPYRIPLSTASAIKEARARCGRIIATGTTVVRALEHSAAVFDGAVPPGERLATGPLDASSELRVVDALLSGAHEPGTSHYRLLQAFAGDEILARMSLELAAHDYLAHEYGDSVFIERAAERSAKCGERAGLSQVA